VPVTNFRAFAVEAELELRLGRDTRAPGGEVTVALCGNWDHDGPCRWPHNSRIDTSTSPARLRTVVAADDDTVDEVVARIGRALRGDSRWSVRECRTDSIKASERSLARDLVQDVDDTS
jgi:hypothetical protein